MDHFMQNNFFLFILNEHQNKIVLNINLGKNISPTWTSFCETNFFLFVCVLISYLFIKKKHKKTTISRKYSLGGREAKSLIIGVGEKYLNTSFKVDI